jgi:nicotinate phosphoribosyltransferase
VGVSADAPWTDCAYKLVEYAGRAVLKLSTKKQTLPGPKQVFRFRGSGGTYLRDVIARAEERSQDGEPLLGKVMEGGRRVTPDPTLEELRKRFRREFACLPQRHKALRSPEVYDVRISKELEQLRQRVVRETTAREIGSDGEARQATLVRAQGG